MHRLSRMDWRKRNIVLMGGSKIIPWYLSGGIPLANCVGAYQTQGAADLAASQINVAHPGIHDLTSIGTGIITLDSVFGWIFDWLTVFDTGIVPESTWSMILRINNGYYGFYGVSSDNVFPAPEINFRTGFGGSGISEYHVGLNQTDGTTPFSFSPITTGVSQYQGYTNGLPDAPSAVPYVWSATDCFYSIYIGGYNMSGMIVGVNVFISNFAVYDIPLTYAQMLDVSNAMLALP